MLKFPTNAELRHAFTVKVGNLLQPFIGQNTSATEGTPRFNKNAVLFAKINGVKLRVTGVDFDLIYRRFDFAGFKNLFKVGFQEVTCSN